MLAAKLPEMVVNAGHIPPTGSVYPDGALNKNGGPMGKYTYIYGLSHSFSISFQLVVQSVFQFLSLSFHSAEPSWVDITRYPNRAKFT